MTNHRHLASLIVDWFGTEAELRARDDVVGELETYLAGLGVNLPDTLTMEGEPGQLDGLVDGDFVTEQQAAAAVLSECGDFRYRPGSAYLNQFVQAALIADLPNQARLARAHPVIMAAITTYRTVEGGRALLEAQAGDPDA